MAFQTKNKRTFSTVSEKISYREDNLPDETIIAYSFSFISSEIGCKRCNCIDDFKLKCSRLG